MSLDPNFALLKRFDILHLRNLPYLQDELWELQKQLDDLDDSEETSLYLSSRKHDRNEERRVLLPRLQTVLQNYGTYTCNQRLPFRIFAKQFKYC